MLNISSHIPVAPVTVPILNPSLLYSDALSIPTVSLCPHQSKQSQLCVSCSPTSVCINLTDKLMALQVYYFHLPSAPYAIVLFAPIIAKIFSGALQGPDIFNKYGTDDLAALNQTSFVRILLSIQSSLSRALWQRYRYTVSPQASA